MNIYITLSQEELSKEPKGKKHIRRTTDRLNYINILRFAAQIQF